MIRNNFRISINKQTFVSNAVTIIMSEAASFWLKIKQLENQFRIRAIDIIWVLPFVLDGTERVVMLNLTGIFNTSVSVSSKNITTLAFLLWLTAFYLIQFLLLKLVTDTEHTITSVVAVDVVFALCFDFQTCVSAINAILINFISYWNKKPKIVIILDENLFSIFPGLSLFIMSEWIYVKWLSVHFASKLSVMVLNARAFHIQFFKKITSEIMILEFNINCLSSKTSLKACFQSRGRSNTQIMKSA